MHGSNINKSTMLQPHWSSLSRYQHFNAVNMFQHFNTRKVKILTQKGYSEKVNSQDPEIKKFPVFQDFVFECRARNENSESRNNLLYLLFYCRFSKNVVDVI